MKKINIKLVFFLIFISTMSVTDLYSDSSDIKNENYYKLQNIIRDTVDYIPALMKKSNCPGLAVIIVNKDEVIWKRAFGFTGTDQSSLVDFHTIFSIQSMSKSFTTLGVLNGVKQGILDLDTPVIEYLPDFKVNSYFEKNPEEKISLRILLGHRAGFPHEAPVGNNYNVSKNSFIEHIKSINQTWLRFKVNEKYSYSNLGIDLAGYILGKVSGLGFEKYMEENIFFPAGMNRTSFDLEKIMVASNRASGTDRFINEIPVKVPMIPSGGLYTSIFDLSRYLRYVLDPENEEFTSLPGPEFLEKMYSIPLLMWDNTSSYGLGIVKKYRNDSYLFTHSGGGFGFNSDMRWYPEYNLGIAVLSNTADNISAELSNMILDRIIKETLIKNKFSKINPLIQDFSGKYRIKIHGQPLLTVTLTPGSGNQIILEDSTSGIYVLKEKQPSLFFTERGSCLDLSGSSPFWNNIPLEKIEFRKIEIIVLYALLTIFSGVLLLILLRSITRKIRKITITNPDKPVSKLFFSISILNSGISAGYLFSLYTFAQFLIYYGLPDNPGLPLMIRILLKIPWVILSFTFLQVSGLILIRRIRYMKIFERIVYYVLTVSSLILVALLFYWKMLPFQV
ncbi:MAG: serine hydrolase [Acidobacteriota bacterium]